MHSVKATAVACAVLALFLAPACAHAQDSGGRYLSLLPVGQGSEPPLADFTAQTLTGEPPAPFVNQRGLFEALLPIGRRWTTRTSTALLQARAADRTRAARIDEHAQAPA